MEQKGLGRKGAHLPLILFYQKPRSDWKLEIQGSCFIPRAVCTSLSKYMEVKGQQALAGVFL